MFTGIIEETGTIKNIKVSGNSATIAVNANIVLQDTKIGDSICTNGICLTVTDMGKGYFCADVMAETMRRTNLGSLTTGDKVNLERALLLNTRLGGHIVSGHIDGTATISNMAKEDNAVWIEITANNNILKYIVEKGSVAIDGISLTVAKLTNNSFSVSIIPHTGEETVLLNKKKGDLVNIECDIIGKYVDKLIHFSNNSNDKEYKEKSNITEDFLKLNGFF